MGNQVIIVMSEVVLRRLFPALTQFVRQRQDYRIVSIHRSLTELEEVIREIRRKSEPAGVIAEWLPGKTERVHEMFGAIPMVMVNTDEVYPGVVSVDVNDRAVGREAATVFRQGGFQSYACLGNGMPYSEQRISGFKEGLGGDVSFSKHTADGFDTAHYDESFVPPDRAFRDWLKHLPKPVGIFAVHDPLGRYLCAACEEVGCEVPSEVSVIGANDDPIVCGLTFPMLSSVSIPWERVGAVVGEAMEEMIRGAIPANGEVRLVEPGTVVLRQSANWFAVEDAMLRRSMTYLSQRLQEPINIALMCDELRIARRTLERKFQEYYRCSPKEMLSQLRIGRAKQLLMETNHSIAMVSDLCGFNDPERMATVFRRLEGISPSHYRKSMASR